VDAVRPDPPAARRFSDLVNRYVADRSDREARDEIRRWLTLWVSNDARFTVLATKRQILSDAAPVSAMLSKIAAQALAGAKDTPEMQTAQKPIGEVRLTVAAAIAKYASAGQ
jgi:hypothetical protein